MKKTETLKTETHNGWSVGALLNPVLPAIVISYVTCTYLYMCVMVMSMQDFKWFWETLLKSLTNDFMAVEHDFLQTLRKTW